MIVYELAKEAGVTSADVIKAADYLIDMGPEGGRNGGTIVAMGTPEEVAAAGVGHTAPFLAAELAR